MILYEMEDKLVEKKNGVERVYPQYEGYSLPNVPHTVASAFGINSNRKGVEPSVYNKSVSFDGIENVVTLLLDGLGYEMLKSSFGKQGLFDRLSKNGVVAPITSTFPSTTAAAITTMSTGLTPQEHSLPEWKIYFKGIDMIINTLPFTSLEDKSIKHVLGEKADPKMLYDGETFYQQLGQNGVESFNFVNRHISKSVYNNLIKYGSKGVRYDSTSSAVITLRKKLEEKSQSKRYFEFYSDTIDSTTHVYGPGTEESIAEIETVSYLLERELLSKVDKKVAEETIVVLTADHGHTRINPADTVYLNKYEEVVDSFDISEAGKPIEPSGGCRDVFMHIKDAKVDFVVEYLSDKLKDVAKIMKMEDAINAGWFGSGKPSERFRERVGNVLILPYDNKSVWYEHNPGSKVEYIGMHGGLTREEMLIPFGIARLSDLM